MTDNASTSTTELPQLEIVRAAARAPSPDNNQPWRFRFSEKTLFVEHDRSRALPSDIDGIFDLQSLGAAIENACLAAEQFGFASQASYLAGRAGPAVAQIEFFPGGRPDPLAEFLFERSTNRCGYSRRQIAAESLERLASEALSASPSARVDWISDRARIRRLAGLVAAGDRLRFEYREFHAELFRQLRFTPAEVERTGDGLDLRLLALPPGGRLTLRMLRSWRMMNLLNQCGLSRLLTLSSAVAAWQSGALAVLSIPSDSPAEFVVAGRALERLWLAAARERLSVHPLGSLPILLRRVERSRRKSEDGQAAIAPLSAAHRRLSEKIGRKLQNMLPSIADRTVTMLLRIGYGRPPALKSQRRPAHVALVGHDR